jgi:hypothetical protein
MPVGVMWYVLGWRTWRAEKLSDVAAREGKKIKEFGYIETAEPKPLIRLACQAKAQGAVSIVIPPWNGNLGNISTS